MSTIGYIRLKYNSIP